MRKYFKKIHKNKIDWKCGASTILFYLCLMWLIVLAVVLFVQLSVAFQGASKSQLFSDVLADGSAYIGNNGWGLNEEDAEGAFTTLAEFNKTEATGELFEDVDEGSISYTYTDADGIEDTTQEEFNTTIANTTWKSTLISDPSTGVNMNKPAATRITYSGGMRIVLEAWHHSYQYFLSIGAEDPDAGQTWYVWGGGHNGDDEEWKTYADCSGFVTGVYRECGYNVPEYATGQLEYMGTTVGNSAPGSESAFANAMPGDVILYWYNGTADGGSAHTGIYAGYYDGSHWMVHCSGDQSNFNAQNAKKGSMGGGAVLTPINVGSYSRIKVNRIVDSDAETTEIDPSLTSIDGFTEDETTIYWALREFGYGNTATCALLGCMHGEGMGYSWKIENYYGTTPSAVEQSYMNVQVDRDEFINGRPSASAGPGYGIAQWTSENRKARLYANSDGYVSNIYSQIVTLEQELAQDFPGLNAYLRNLPDYADAETLDYATYQCMLQFEGIMNGSITDRQRYASSFYSKAKNL